MRTFTQITTTLLALLIAFSAYAQDDLTEAASDISDVTVFLQRAQVTRTGKVLLRKGSNTIMFRGLARGIDPRSIQVAAPDEILINSVIHEVNYLNRQKDSPRITVLKDSLKYVNNQLKTEANEKTVLDQERDMILKNQALASEETGVDIDELQKAAEFFRNRLTDISKRQLEIKRRQDKLKARRRHINAQLKELNYVRNQPSNDIRVVMKTYATREVKVQLRYVVKNAGWVPRYDLRAGSLDKPIQLDYRADVFQNTGKDWEGVNLTLSSGNPNLGGTQPELQPWKLYVQQYRPQYDKKAKGRAYAESAKAEDEAYGTEEAIEEPEEEEDDDWGDNATLADYTTVEEGATTAEFVISIPQTILSGSKPQQVAVQSSELPAEYRHFAVPKLDKDAFLLAEVTEWEKLNLLAGKVQIFFDGTYVAESAIDPSYTSDTLRFSLGRDKKVIVQRENLKDYNEKKTIGLYTQRTYGYEITVRNTKPEAISLRLEEQFPISQDKDVTVKLIEHSNAKKNDETGMLHWDMDLKQAETKSVRLVFSVKYPKNKVVTGGGI